MPASAAPVKISAIESTVLPISVAMQTVSKSYVDTAIAAAVTGHPLDSNPFTLKSGDAMTGPLVLPADPVAANQAANKNYVDQTVAASANSGTQKISLGGDLGGTATAPLVTGIQGSPVATTAPALGQTLIWNGSAYVPATPADDDLASPPAIGNVTAAPSLSAAGTNYPSWDGGNDFADVNFNCQQTTLPGESSNAYISSYCLAIPTYNDWTPGFDYGSPGNYPIDDFGEYVTKVFGTSMNSTSASQSLTQELNLTKTGPGEAVMINLNGNFKPACISGSTECVHMIREALQEIPPAIGTVAVGGGGANATVLTLSSPTSVGLNSPMIDVNSSTACNVSAVASGTPLPATVSCTVGISTTGTSATAIASPRILGNTSGQLSKTVVTATLNTTSDLSLNTNKLIAFLAPPFSEVVRPSSYGTYNGSAHTQTITATFHYSHPSGTVFYAGGAVGGYWEPTTTTATSQRYAFNVYGSTGVHTLLLGYQYPNQVMSNGVAVGSGNLYQGAEVYGVLNPGTGKPDGAYAVVGDNNAAWADGDSVEDLNAISAAYFSEYYNTFTYNPWAARVLHKDQWYGAGGGLTIDDGDDDFSVDTSTPYLGATGGIYHAPYYASIAGPISVGFSLQYAPLYASGGTSPGAGGPNCHSFICIGEGVYPGSTSTKIGIVQPQADYSGNEFTYDTATGHFAFTGALDLNASAVCTLATGCGSGGGVALVTSNGVDTVSITPTAPSSSPLTIYSAGGLYGTVEIKNNSAGGQLCLEVTGHWCSVQVDGYGDTNLGNAGGHYAQFDLYGNLDLTHTPNPTMVKNLTVTGQYVGPATAPTGGGCTTGAWVFSQDGHATFCAAGTWSTKI